MSMGRTSHTHAHLIQCAKCLHQVALDSGDRSRGELFLMTPDPLSVETYAGEPFEMEGIARYRKMCREMSTSKSRQRKSSSESSQEQGEEEKKKKKRKKKKKGTQEGAPP